MRYHKGSATMIGLAVAVLVAVGAGGGYYYYTQNIAPKMVLADTVSTVTDAEKLRSFRYEGSVEGTYDVSFSNGEGQTNAEQSEQTQEAQTFSTSFDGVLDRTDSDNVEGKLNVQSENAGQGGQPTNMKVRFMENMLYVSGAQAFGNQSGEQKQWLEVDTTKEGGQPSEGAFGGSQLQTMPNPNETLNFDISESERQELQTAFRENQFVTITDTYGSQEIKGVSSHHYGYSFQKQAYLSFLKEAQSILGNEQITDKQISANEQFVQKLDTLTGELWVAEDSKYLTKLTADMKMNSEKSTMSDLSLSMTMSEHNTDFTVQKPESTQSLEEVFQGVFPDASQESLQQESSPKPENMPENFENFDQETLQSSNNNSELSEEKKKQLFPEYQGN